MELIFKEFCFKKVQYMLEGNILDCQKMESSRCKAIFGSHHSRVGAGIWTYRACRPRLWGIHLAICELRSQLKISTTSTLLQAHRMNKTTRIFFLALLIEFLFAIKYGQPFLETDIIQNHKIYSFTLLSREGLLCSLV